MLNSERIKQKFGSYGVEVMQTSVPNLRVSNLYSEQNGKRVCRTFAVTQFEPTLHAELQEGHRRIVVENQSIGSTFKDLGFTISKENLYIGTFEPKSSCIFDLMGGVKPQPLAVYIYRLSLSKGEVKNLPYAIIAEIQHPDYLTRGDLENIYVGKSTPMDLNGTWVSINVALANLMCAIM